MKNWVFAGFYAVQGKLNTPHESVACRPPLAAILWSNRLLCDCLSVSHIVMDSLFFTTLPRIIEVCGHSFMYSSFNVKPQSFNLMEAIDSFHSQPFCCRFVAVLWIVGYCMIQCWSSFSCQIFDSRILRSWSLNTMSATCPGPVAGKQAQIMTPPSPCLSVGLRYLYWYAAFGFYRMWHYGLWPYISTFSYVQGEEIIHYCLVFF